ncbi:MAG: alcohol dehydrogenase [Microbacterium sp. SCN 70-200]|uniref:alcohol dehydrogenase catalytic domain-containing protein n=1 Tax=unclassified Microbacterium TaxID=2609290 RepID=UPI00086F613C|nr:MULTISPECIES: alcohol dehydrogenase catalytic domain-containing protein [unclassified Microbacterium]MBN9216015.1 alcohol dehydrogenase catalytic domain-containing protein [Microbacterium sp.]ODT40360.1 MAG: alcohol dehydrogenase [Microbacterium sp. SCN 70-200]OJV82073.1 MAG: alcohol dehydrogenase [Microbacterium sp. 70-16]
MRITGAVLEEIGRARPFAQSKPISISTLELGEPGPTEVLVRIEAAGVCHSDLSVVDGNRVRPVPMLLGHEAAGIVESFGDEVTDLAVGERVVMAFLPRCGECAGCATDGRLPCERGTASNNAGTLLHGERRLTRDGRDIQHHLGVSGFATHAVVDRVSIVRVPADVPADVAAVLGCAVLTGGGALLNAVRPEPGDSVMIVGLGGVGMAALIAAIAEGKGDVIAVDNVPEKLELARELGATAAYTPAEVAERGIRASHALECAGHPRAFETAFAATAPGGRTVTVGLPDPAARASISPLTITGEARAIIGSYLGSAVPARDIPRFVDWWRAGRLPIERLITRRIRLDEINDAMDDLADGRAVRQVIMFDEG